MIRVVFFLKGCFIFVYFWKEFYNNVKWNVCLFIGVCWKCMKGDMWVYKKVCEEFLVFVKFWKFSWIVCDMCVLVV